MLVEVCANSLQSALHAQQGGADRIELCSELGVGGITPSYGLLKSIREHITIPVHVLIRPRGGDFTYSKEELEIMKKDIDCCVDLGFEGIVGGALDKDLNLDINGTRSLIEASCGLHFTFHRAFDWVKDPLTALDQLEDMGVRTLLSSGQQKSAMEGMDLLLQLKEQATACTIMPGSGIKVGNLREFKNKGFMAVHFSGSRDVRKMDSPPELSMYSVSKLKDDLISVTDMDMVRLMVKEAK